MQGFKDRGARFVTTICLYYTTGETHFFEDYLYGEIAEEYKGENGFGYDPIFIVDGLNKHLASACQV